MDFFYDGHFRLEMVKEIYKEFYLTGTTRNVAKDMMDMKEYTRILGIERETRINELLND